MKDIIDLLGRIFLSIIFLWDAVDFIFFYKSTKQAMINYGISWSPDFFLIVVIIFLIIGGLMVLMGYRVTIGTSLLLFYWVPATFILHDFWNYDLPERRFEALMFYRNVAIAGGLMMLYAHGSGRYAVRRLFATTRVPRRW